MSAAQPSEERQKIINNNRSLRTIKNELESLIEHGAISDDVYATIMSALPAEAPLGSARGSVVKNNDQNKQISSTSSMSVVPVRAMNEMRLDNNSTPVPSSTPTPVPASTPVRPEIARAIAIYPYTEPGECNFQPNDQISVYEYMNPDWWFGKNLRTGQEGIFPHNYVQLEAKPSQSAYVNEKSNMYPGGYHQPYQQHVAPPPAGPINPYDSSVPPMQLAGQPTDSKLGKGGEMGKKFGKKLGNAAIFGAGATIGGNIVNSIF